MPTLKFSRTINRPAEEILDLPADIRRNPEWCPGFTAAEKLSPGPVGLNALFSTATPGTGTMQIRITRYERPTTVVWRDAEADGDGTQLHVRTAGGRHAGGPAD